MVNTAIGTTVFPHPSKTIYFSYNFSLKNKPIVFFKLRQLKFEAIFSKICSEFKISTLGAEGQEDWLFITALPFKSPTKCFIAFLMTCK